MLKNKVQGVLPGCRQRCSCGALQLHLNHSRFLAGHVADRCTCLKPCSRTSQEGMHHISKGGAKAKMF